MKKVLKSVIWEAVSQADRIVRPKVRIIPANRLYALIEVDQLMQFFRYFRVDCVFDIGANMGQYATMLRQQVAYRGSIISFEPVPECAAQLRRLARSDPRWIVEEMALSDRAGMVAFNVMADTQFSSLSVPDNCAIDIFKSVNSIQREIRVYTDTIANVFHSYKSRLGFSRPYLKMDTQGSDLAVAKGAENKLEEFVGLQSELAILPIYVGAPTFTEAIGFYESHGFTLTAFVPNNAGHFPYLVEIDCIMFNSKFEPANRSC